MLWKVLSRCLGIFMFIFDLFLYFVICCFYVIFICIYNSIYWNKRIIYKTQYIYIYL